MYCVGIMTNATENVKEKEMDPAEDQQNEKENQNANVNERENVATRGLILHIAPGTEQFKQQVELIYLIRQPLYSYKENVLLSGNEIFEDSINNLNLMQSDVSKQ